MGWITRSNLSRTLATLIAGLLLSVQAGAQSDADVSPPPPDYVAAAFDAAIVRPLALSLVVVGAAWFVPAAIVSAPGGRNAIREAWERFVLAPVNFVFTRPLGKF